MSLRQLTIRAPQASRSVGRVSRIPHVRQRATSSHAGASTRSPLPLLVAAGVVTGLSAYLLSNQIRLEEANTPVDSGHTGKPAKGAKRGNQGPMVKIKDVLDKKNSDDVWVVIKGEVYDVTEWVHDHPGGPEIILNNKSKDVTHIFNPRHPSDQLEGENLPTTVHHLGMLQTEGASEEDKEALMLKVSKDEEDDEERVRKAREKMEETGLGVIVNMKDFEKFAEPMLSKVAWAYYASAADDEITKNSNASAYQNVTFRPRILQRVAKADCTTTIMGKESALPLFISPAAMAKLGHPDGEINLTKGAANTGIIQCISSNASCSVEEINAARAPGQPLFFQLYVNRKREVAAELIKKVDRLGMDAIMMTGDAPVGGKRERDLRLKGEFEGPAGGVSEKSGETQGVSQAMFAGVDPDLHWDDIPWVRSLTDTPIIIKGVQTVEDALLAYERGADGILISNHGGRQLDTTRPCLDVLLEIRKHAPQLLRPEFRGDTGLNPESLKNLAQVVPPSRPGKMERPFEVYIDGGINRGTDVVKALCLGANAVGVGRGFLFAQSVAGVEGVEHAVGILQSEILLTLRLLGVNKLSELRPSMVEVKS
ncbi:L-lactate dehydrogenase [Dioszegia hungarica]|uniref:L-lactate dehydrogenase n=1 Tax=Dioszegia hungarica TaxID=4972 RepID=A0AA38HFI4_9TREE|nr:L-lactate dehydrogenase [Dioszegia hungarica]KAI9638614.1 L-lactate dehydrogenase [Dioszegia hungarica]